MKFISITADDPSNFSDIDPDDVLAKLKLAFPEMTSIPGDQLMLRYDRTRQMLDPTCPTARIVLAMMLRDAKQQGPAYAFRIPLSGEERIHGVAKQRQIQFGFNGKLPMGMRARILEFLDKFVRSRDFIYFSEGA